MKSKIYHLFILLAVIGSSSCKKFLDTKPTSFGSPADYYQNTAQLQTALNAVYNELIQQAYYGPYGSDRYFALDITNDESINNGTPYPESAFNYSSTDSHISTDWASYYQGIERDNLLLASFPQGDSLSADQVIKGQALFMRGYFYFTLVTQFGAVPLLTQPTGSVTGNLAAARTPVKAVYTQILSDMEAADSILSAHNYTATSLGYTEPVTVEACEGFLAKVCLFMASPGPSGTPVDATKYTDAMNWAGLLVNDATHYLNANYTQTFINLVQDKYDRETLWDVGFNTTTGTGSSTFVFYTAIAGSPGGASGSTYITLKLNSAYAPWDSVRHNWNCPNFFYTSAPGNGVASAPYTFAAAATNITTIASPWNYNAGKWRRIYEPNSAAMNGGVSSGQGSYCADHFPLLRLADVYLIYAEAANAANGGPTAAAYNAINAVRRRAFKVSVATPNAVCDLPAGLSQAAFQDSLMAERMRELCFEGIRKDDEIRWGTFLSDMQNLLSLANSAPPSSGFKANNPTVYTTLGSNQKFNLLPIPNSELQLNNLMIQNPGW